MTTIIIIGGGPAGFFSAIHNKQNHPNCTVILIEKSTEVLSKVKISGGGRCNVTNACFDPKSLSDYYPRGAKELRGPLHQFQPKDTMAWFKSHGVPLKTEPDNRVFPVSDSSQSIIDCLLNTATQLGVKVWRECGVNAIKKKGSDFYLTLSNNKEQNCQKLVLATGSSRSGYKLAKNLGHTIITPLPSLFTAKIDDPELHQLSGLSVEKASIWISGHKKQMQTGPLLLTHWGISGPSIIKLSSWNAETLCHSDYKALLIINWLEDLNEDQIKQEILNHQSQNPKKTTFNKSPFLQIPHRLWGYIIKKTKINQDQTWNNLSKKQFNKLIEELSQGQYKMNGKGQFKEEFVTCGGVDLKEINFKTMESKRCQGLYIVGELLNVDGITGGFNFQNAWTTGYISGNSHI